MNTAIKLNSEKMVITCINNCVGADLKYNKKIIKTKKDPHTLNDLNKA